MIDDGGANNKDDIDEDNLKEDEVTTGSTPGTFRRTDDVVSSQD